MPPSFVRLLGSVLVYMHVSEGRIWVALGVCDEGRLGSYRATSSFPQKTHSLRFGLVSVLLPGDHQGACVGKRLASRSCPISLGALRGVFH